MRRLQLARLLSPVAVEIGGGRLDERHALAKDGFELV